MNSSSGKVLSIGAAVVTFVQAFLLTDVVAQDYKTHFVKTGDTLYRIARQNYVTVQSLRELNRINDDVIKPGQVLWIDGRPEEDSLAAAIVDSVSAAELAVTPDSSEIARIGVPEIPDSTKVDEVLQVSQEDTTGTGQEIETSTLEGVATESIDSGNPADSVVKPTLYDHVVESGETLFSIAARYGVSADSLAVANPSHPTYLVAGDTVKVPWGMQLGKHRVRSGETLYRISRTYDTTVERIRTLNDLEGTDIMVGQQLMVPLRPADADTHLFIEPDVVGSGVIAVYPEMFEGRLMANGKPYMPDKFTVSHGDLQLGTIVLLIDPSSGRQTFAEVTDRLPSGSDVFMEVSRVVAGVLALDKPTDPVEVRRIR